MVTYNPGRALDQPNADGSAQPTMDYLNPQWAQFFDRLKVAGGGITPTIEGGAGQMAPAMGDTEDTAAPGYDAAVNPLLMNYDPKTINQSLKGLKAATKVTT